MPHVFRESTIYKYTREACFHSDASATDHILIPKKTDSLRVQVNSHLTISCRNYRPKTIRLAMATVKMEKKGKKRYFYGVISLANKHLLARRAKENEVKLRVVADDLRDAHSFTIIFCASKHQTSSFSFFIFSVKVNGPFCREFLAGET